MRGRFDRQLETLHQELIHMGALCEEAISAGVQALLEGDGSMADTAMARERDIDQKERDIEALCMRLLLQQQPVARDLRAISSALKLIGDMERIGDQAADIAEIARHMDGGPLPAQVHISDMTSAAVKMVTDSVESFVQGDPHMARAVMAYDDVVDRLFDEVKGELTELIRADSRGAGQALDLLMIAKYLERIGDHAVNVAEWVLYAVTGVHGGQQS
mgnify:FL=1